MNACDGTAGHATAKKCAVYIPDFFPDAMRAMSKLTGAGGAMARDEDPRFTSERWRTAHHIKQHAMRINEQHVPV